MNSQRKRVTFHTLGCKLNFAETSTISRSLPDDCFEKVAPDKEADIHIINTCSVTATADKKCRQLINHITKHAPEAFIVVTGCYAQLQPQKLSKIPGVDLVLGSNEKSQIASLLKGSFTKQTPAVQSCEPTPNDLFFPAYSMGDRTRSFLKVQDGCDYRCSYCTIPKARGKSRNPTISSLVDEANVIAANGVREIVLTGVNIGDFGRSTNDSFFDLLTHLVEIKGIDRYRISSIEPNLLTNEILDLASRNGKIAPHFHIPLQNGCDTVLHLMRRRYNRDVFADRVLRIKELIPNAGIGADVITGFPGETSECFEDSFNFLNSLPLSYLHVFPFSERPNTDAINLPNKVDYSEKEARSKRLTSLSLSKHLDFLKSNIGHEERVLFEAPNDSGMMTGFTGNYIKVELPWDQELIGKMRNVKLLDISPSGRMTIKLL